MEIARVLSVCTRQVNIRAAVGDDGTLNRLHVSELDRGAGIGSAAVRI